MFVLAGIRTWDLRQATSMYFYVYKVCNFEMNKMDEIEHDILLGII